MRIMLGRWIRPEPKTIALGGVPAGSAKSHEDARVTAERSGTFAGRRFSIRLTVAVFEATAERATVEKQAKLGKRAVFGDISNPDVLESVGIHEADAVVLTIPDDDATLRACRAIRQIRADVFIAVAAADWFMGAQQQPCDRFFLPRAGHLQILAGADVDLFL